MSKIKELKEKKARVWEQLKAITDVAYADGKRGLTPEEETKWETIDKDFLSIEKQISIEETTQKREAEMSKPAGNAGAGEGITMREAISELVRNNGRVSEEVRNVLYSGMSKEERAQTTQTNSSGGYLIPVVLAKRIIESLKDFGGIRGISDVQTTASGNEIQWPTSDDTANTGSWIGENTQVSESNLAFGQKSINAYKNTSGVFRIPRELLEDSQFDIESFIVKHAGRRIARLENTAFVKGDGSSKPTGFTVDATIGMISASNAAVTTNELIDLLHTIDPAYRKLGLNWVFNDTTLKLIRKLKDDNGLYVWQMGDIRTGAPSTLLGHTYVVEQDMDSFGAGKKPIAIGNFKEFMIRDTAGVRMMNLVERYADYDQIGVIAFHRTDSKLLDTAAVKVMRNPTT